MGGEASRGGTAGAAEYLSQGLIAAWEEMEAAELNGGGGRRKGGGGGEGGSEAGPVGDDDMDLPQSLMYALGRREA